MAHTMVETPNAKYVLIFSAHTGQKELSPVAFDALVAESSTLGNTETARLSSQALVHGAEVWVTDARPSEKSVERYDAGITGVAATATIGGMGLIRTLLRRHSRRAFLKGSVSIGLLTPFTVLLSSFLLKSHKGKITHERAWHATTKLGDLIAGKGVTSIRNAIAAEKCEAFLAPRLRQKLGRKPVIAMSWGGGHYGIKELLEQPRTRRKILRENRLTDYVREDYPVSWRYKRDKNDEWKVIETISHSLPVPKPRPPRPEKSPPLTRRELLWGRVRRKRKA